jgi:hypothetical protein
VYKSGELLRCCVDGGVDTEGGALVRCAGKEVDKCVSCIVP